MEAIKVHAGDDLPPIYAQLVDDESGMPLDLSGATTVVSAKFRAKVGSTVLATVTCTKPFGGADGRVKMAWGATQLDIDAGRYEIEISVAYDGAVQTVNRYYWESGMSLDDAKTCPVKVLDDF